MQKKYVTVFSLMGILLALTFFTHFSFSSQTTAVSKGTVNMNSNSAIATFAGGCFWCMEPPFENLKGVSQVISGYTGGHTVNPTYEEVSHNNTGHIEAVEIHFDPKEITYQDLLEVFWRNIDPTDKGGQFADRGDSYLTAIFYHDEEQKKLAEESIAALDKSRRFDRPVVTPLREAGVFYRAEEYHQDYYKKNSTHYKMYRRGSGREHFIERTWGDEKDYTPSAVSMSDQAKTYSKPSEDDIKSQLTKLQYQVTQKDGTERPFDNAFWNNHEEGVYVDIVSGEPLFSSRDKFESGTGWPSFTRPLEKAHVIEKKDSSFFMTRTEVRSRYGDSHLGHLFEDGPEPTGLRYCINSASLKFVPVKKLKEEGLGQYLELFNKL